MKTLPLLLGALALLSSIYPLSAQAFLGDALFLPPHADYQQLETAHFKVIYPQKYRVEADESAVFLEDAHDVLSKAFNYSPGHKTTIILTDNQDYANGVTSALGLQGIVLFLTSPDPYSSIGEYDHWLRNLIIHEYSHYLTLEQTRGIFQLARYVFGNLLFPNHAWPTSIAEGIAVYAESDFTHRGRGHGTYYTTLTRDALHRNKLLEFDQLMGPVPDYPFGEALYYGGYAMLDEMTQLLGPTGPGRFAEESSWRIPYFNNGTLENISLGAELSFQSLWSGWLERQRKSLAPELGWLKQGRAEDPEFLTSEGVSALGARLSPDGKRLAYLLTSGHERPAVKVIELAAKKTTHIDDAVSGANLSWSADGQTIYYAKADFQGPYAFYSDIYRWKDGSVDRVTKGERAKDPTVCGKFVVYATQRGRISELRAVPLDGDTHENDSARVLYRAPNDHHISVPRCTPDGARVYFAKHGIEPLDAVYALELSQGSATGEPRHVVGGLKQGFGALYPEPLANGGFYFTRVRDGFYDLARWDARTEQVIAVARASGGYWTPSYSQGKLGVSYVTSTGVRAAVVDPARLEREVGPTIAQAPLSAQAKFQSGDAHPELQTGRRSTQILERKGYNLLESLTPRIWSPFILIENSQTQLGGNILGWDDIDQLEYNVFAWYDSVPRKPEGILATFHRVIDLKLGLSFSSQITDFVVTSSGRRVYDEERKISVKLARPFPGVFSRFIPSVIGEWARTYRDGDFVKRTFSPDMRLGAELAFDNFQRFPYSLTAEKGMLLRAEGRRFFANGDQAWKGLINWNPLVPLWPRHSSLSLNTYAVVAPQPQEAIVQSVVHVGGHGTLSDLDPPLRGYPLGNFVTRRAGVFQAEYRLPLAQVFRGFGTWPLFLRNFGAFGFYDGAKMQSMSSDDYGPLVGGVGGGLLLNTELGYMVPVQLRLEFAHGLRKDLNGQDSFSVNLAL